MISQKPKRRIRKEIKEVALLCSIGFAISLSFVIGMSAIFGKDELTNTPMYGNENVVMAKYDATEKDESVVDTAKIDATKEITIEELIEEKTKEYDIPYDIVISIARLETGWFTSDAYINGNNPGGMSVNEVPLSYASIEEGVEAFVSNLAKNYFMIGLDTPEEIGKKYCPTNPNWVKIVKELVDEYREDVRLDEQLNRK